MIHRFVATRDQFSDVHIDVDSIRALLERCSGPDRLYFLVDELLLSRFHQRCHDLGFLPGDRVSTIRGGEGAKSFHNYRRLLADLEGANVRRRDSLVCVGGSAISDVGGFVAATYLRGIKYVNIPTTVLAQVDGGFGGKVAVNMPGGKNAVGAFWHPTDVFVDHSWLSTLSKSEVSHGFAESVKVACLDGSGHLFQVMESVGERLVAESETTGVEVIRLSLLAKMHLLSPDPFERDLRRLLNLGHTVAHSLETATNYGDIHHGAAVAIGIATACRYGRKAGMNNPEYVARVIDLLSKLALPISVDDAMAERVASHLASIRRVRDGAINYVIPVDVGRAVVLPEINQEFLRGAMIGE